MIDTRVNFDLAETEIVAFALKLSTAKMCPRPRSQRGIYPAKCAWKRIKIYPYSPVAFRCNPEKWQSKRTDLDILYYIFVFTHLVLTLDRNK